MFGKDRIIDPYNTMGTSSPRMDDGKRFLRNLEAAARKAPDKESRKRIDAYRDSVAANYAAGYPVGDGSAYRNLTRSDCALVWRPGCPEANDPSRRP
jgi:hypothetical protein